ncbi:MAG: sulfotransferase [Phycisphaerales bacterium]|nr:sulfotransferase [Phycisphaerales bacterium]
MNQVEPVFIIGCIRSGTTILHQVLMDYCPRAIDIDDVDFECRTFWQERGFRIGSPKTGTRCCKADAGDLTDSARDEILNYFAQRTAGGQHIVNKNPHLCNKIGLIHALFPRARIIHIVRENLSVIASTKLNYLSQDERQTNPWGARFVQYWPDEPDFPCWWAVPVDDDAVFREPLRRRLRRVVRGQPQLPEPDHESYTAFRRAHSDASRYFPGGGFRRIPESWVRINAYVVKQIDALDIGSLYMPINYADLVARPMDVIRNIGSFCGFTQTDPSRVPATLDESRRDKWRQDLTDDEQTSVDQVMEQFPDEMRLLTERLPGPLLAAREPVPT